MKQSILLVDDEIDNIAALERLFRKKFNVLKATSGPEALLILEEHSPSVIISDQRMPKMSGVEFLKKSIDLRPDCIRILLTGYTDIDSVILAINSGQIYKYVTKPWDPIDLLNTVEKSVEKYLLRAELKLKNAELTKALNELKTLDQAKTNFMMLINHELKTPLTVMSSYLQLLLEENLTDTQAQQLQKVESSTNRLHTLINDSLELIEAETGQRKVTTTNTNVEEIITQALEKQNNGIQKKQLDIKNSLSLKTIKTDSKLLESVITRLIDNAVKFADKNTTIEIHFDETQRFQIINTGKKFDLSKVDQLLSPFSIDEKALNHSKGTGLGLSISQTLLKLVNSRLDIQTEKNKTTISFQL